MEGTRMIVLSEPSGIIARVYYTGKTFINDGECHPITCCMDNKHRVKIYTSPGRARNACEKLNRKTGREFVVDKI
ncbi:hypothetical protein OD350_28965 (plasmid) [Clostridium beijerinckii]|uniref:hypothetical protein n=1 Tax=Clostridium beijerinckii TaxID=1520 RepID=UPI00222755D6|nr:hypothetical protein [Clostridium beijerinckii]UYZ39106.1 hypothetical protein OD350_28965 [Clostridium beijerinckii]